MHLFVLFKIFIFILEHVISKLGDDVLSLLLLLLTKSLQDFLLQKYKEVIEFEKPRFGFRAVCSMFSGHDGFSIVSAPLDHLVTDDDFIASKMKVVPSYTLQLRVKVTARNRN